MTDCDQQCPLQYGLAGGNLLGLACVLFQVANSLLPALEMSFLPIHSVKSARGHRVGFEQ